MKHQRKPSWLKVPPPWGKDFGNTSSILKEYGLETVCKNAKCPNIGECYSSGTATFLIMGNVCTRNCRFCDITRDIVAPLDPNEPIKVARAVQKMKLKFAVVTSVTRDDLPDGGAEHIAQTITNIKKLSPGVKIEVLVSDFQGDHKAIKTVLNAEPSVFNHNIETVKQMYKELRPEASYERSLDVLNFANKYNPQIPTKSGIMVGAGEKWEELQQLFKDLAKVNVQLLTIGQYLPPSRQHFPLDRYYTPEEFNELKELAIETGIKSVVSSPLVRSSYHAKEMEEESTEK